jgi:hypothetical protein
MIGVASVLIRYNTKEKRGDFFEITRSLSDLWENDFQALQEYQQEHLAGRRAQV